MLLIILTSGCGTFVPKLPSVKLERCVIILPNAQTPNGFCGCHPYTISHEVIGRTGDTVMKPLSYCDRFVGFHPDRGWIPLLETLEEAYRAIDDAGASFTPPKTETPEEIKAFTNGI